MAAFARYSSALRRTPPVLTGTRRASLLAACAMSALVGTGGPLLAEEPGDAAAAPSATAPVKPTPSKPAAAKPAAAKPAAAKPAARAPSGAKPAASVTAGRGHRLEERLGAAAAAAGARGTATGLPVQPVTLGALLDSVLRQNYDVRASDESLAAAGASAREREAAFDPTLYATLSYTISDSRSRGDWVARWRRDPSENATLTEEEKARQEATDVVPGDPSTTPRGTACTVTVDGVTYYDESGDKTTNPCFKEPLFFSEYELASYERLKTQQYRGVAGVSWEFPIGIRASANVGVLYNQKYSFQSPTLTSPLSPYDPFGWGGQRFWTSSASLSLSTPLPYTKGFGEDGSTATYAWRLAQSGERVAQWSGRALRNAALAQTLLAYWDLVLGAERLHTIAGHRGLLTEQLGRAQRLAAAQQTSDYDLHQVEASLAQLDRSEEEQWSGYLVTSSRLMTLTAGDRQTVLLPSDTEALLTQPVTATTETAFQLPPDHHPDVKVQEETLETSRIAVRYRENQTRPDISLTTSFSVGQSDAAYGYKGVGTSLAKLLKPDSSDFYVGVRYVIPLGNNQAESALSRARLEEAQSYDQVLQVRQRVVNQTENATHGLTSARALLDQSRDDLELAGLAYETASAQLQEGRVSQYEVLNKLSDLLSARLNHKAAQVAVHKAQIRLMYAQGTLEEAYARSALATGGRL